MRIEIDQSGKIENTERPTVLAFSNKKFRAILIAAREKRILQIHFRKLKKPRMFIFSTFAAMVVCLIKTYRGNLSEIIIDREYYGHEDIIKSLILEISRSQSVELTKDQIRFRSVGKKSRAHILALSSYRNRKSDLKISAKEVLILINKKRV